MREGWKYKTFGEVSEIICGQDYKSVQDENGAYPIYGTGGIMGYASQYRCPANSIIIGRKGSINNPILVEEPFWNVDTAFGVVPNISVVVPKYFYYFCRNYDFTKHDVSVTIPSLRRTDILKIEISVPPLPEQERIVAELDLLTGIIDKQKAQLKELDTLAQSIFYDMFGDPESNEKGWESSSFKDTIRLKSGDGLSEKEFQNGIYPVYGGNGISGYHDSYNKDGEFIIIGRVGAYCGNVRYIKGRFWLTDNAFQAFFEIDKFGFQFMCYLLNRINLHQYANQAAQPVISNVGLKDISIICPPQKLQQSFAEKIQSIESQKASINRSIAETRKLFDYTMDKYFG